MPTTSNFGWTTPADTDLVKDGAAAIRTLGNGIDTSLVDLKGGTTGQVLSKASNTDLDFSWTNADPLTILDAKGDLISATAADTPARLAVGNNGETLVADSSATTGLRWQPADNGNFIINGGMDIWQRGTSFTGASPYYTADRFVGLRATAAAGGTFSRQTSGLTGFQYSIRCQRNSGNTGTEAVIISQSLESVMSYPIAGQAVTLSFYAKCGANYSSASSALSSQIRYGTGSDQNYITGSYTGDTQVVAGTHTLTTSWQRFSITGTVNSAATEVGFDLRYTPVGTAGANDWFEVTGIQLELGSVPTVFKRSGGTIAGELAACQRYYFRAGGNSVYEPLGQGSGASANAAGIYTKLPVTMRVTPTSIDYSTVAIYDGTNIIGTPDSVVIVSSESGRDYAKVAFTKTSSVTQYRPYVLFTNNSTSGYLGYSAEL